MSTRGFLADKDNRKIFFSISGEEKNNGELWLVCSPIFEEKVFTYSYVKHLAENLVDKGFMVCRFDYLGEGDSDDSNERIGIQDWVNNINDLILHIKENNEIIKVNIIGLRLGANIALEAAKQEVFDKVVLLAPIDSGEKYINELLRYNLSMQFAAYRCVKYDRVDLKKSIASGQSVNILGYELYEKLYNDISGFNLTAQLENIRNKVSVIWFDKTNKASIPDRYIKLSAEKHNVFVTSLKQVPFWHEPKFIDIERAELMLKITETISKMS